MQISFEIIRAIEALILWEEKQNDILWHTLFLQLTLRECIPCNLIFSSVGIYVE